MEVSTLRLTSVELFNEFYCSEKIVLFQEKLRVFPYDFVRHGIIMELLNLVNHSFFMVLSFH